MAFNQQLSVFGQVAPATTGTAGQVLVSAGSSASSYWASAIPVSAYSAQFNGSSYLSVPNNAALNISSSDYTLEGWWYFTDLSNQNLISKYSVSGGYAIQWYSTNNLRMVFNTAGTDTVYQFAWTPTINTWYHIAITRSGSSGRAFINGTQIGSTTTFITANGDGTTTFQIGLTHTTSEYTRGYASNVRVTKGVAIYTGNFTAPTSPLGTSQAAGTNIAAVTPSQVSLLTCNGPGFRDSSPNAFAVTYAGTIIASEFSPFSSFSAISRSATQTQTILTSGSGTYYTPSGVAWLRIRMVGGGGGGGASFAAGSGTQASSGTNTIFGSAQAYAGAGGWNSYFGAGGAGGDGTIGSFSGIVIPGARGSAVGAASINYCGSGTGGSTSLGGAGASSMNGAGFAASTNSGSGGGGGGGNASSSTTAGTGGGAGGYVEAFVSNPAASYAYTVGAGGAGGAAGVFAGGGGGSGIIIVEENYAVNASGAESNITRGTSVATTSGTSIDFTSIPSWVKRITIMLQGASLSGTSNYLFQLGTGGTPTTTGYLGSSASFNATAVASLGFTTGFGGYVASASVVTSGSIVFTNISSNIWVASGVFGYNIINGGILSGGQVSLGGTLNIVRITTVNGTDTFDAGSVNILYE